MEKSYKSLGMIPRLGIVFSLRNLNLPDYDGNKGDYYYVQAPNISAADLDKLQAFTVGSVTFYYSALDYAKAVVESSSNKDAQKTLAKALYLYNQAANTYFG